MQPDILESASVWLSTPTSDLNEYDTRTLVVRLFDEVTQLRRIIDATNACFDKLLSSD